MSKDNEVQPFCISELFDTWVNKLPEEHYIRRYVETFFPCSEAAKAFQTAGAVMSLASVLQNRIAMRMGTFELRPNLYACICGPSSAAKKTTVMNVCLDTIRSSQARVNVINDCTPEGLLGLFEDGKAGFLRLNEFGSLLDAESKKYNAGLHAFMTDIYDCPSTHRRKLQGRDIEVERPTLSVFGGSTWEWIQTKATREMVESGFLARFIWFALPQAPKRLIAFPQAPDAQAAQGLVSHLRDLAMRPPSTITLSADARCLYETWYKEIHEKMKREEGSILDAPRRRKTDVALKMGIILCQGRDSLCGEITAADMEMALWLTDILIAAERDLLCGICQGKQDMQERGRVQRAFQRMPKCGLRRRDLLLSTNLSLRDFTKAVEWFIETGRVKSWNKKGTVFYQWVGEGEQ